MTENHTPQGRWALPVRRGARVPIPKRGKRARRLPVSGWAAPGLRQEVSVPGLPAFHSTEKRQKCQGAKENAEKTVQLCAPSPPGGGRSGRFDQCKKHPRRALRGAKAPSPAGGEGAASKLLFTWPLRSLLCSSGSSICPQRRGCGSNTSFWRSDPSQWHSQRPPFPPSGSSRSW